MATKGLAGKRYKLVDWDWHIHTTRYLCDPMDCSLPGSSVVLEKTLESLLDSTEIKPVNLEYSWRTYAEAEALILWPPDEKSWPIWKDPDAEKDWRQEEKGMTEDEMVGWHCWLNGHEFEQAPGDGEGQGSLVCISPWGHRESDTT